jgi:ubiquinone/menaquinone biosynthesis C-methylase UbiE
MLAELGARVLGVDLCARFIEYANEHRVGSDRYRLDGVQHRLEGVANDSFDLAVSYVSLVDLPRPQLAVREAFRILRPGGRFVVCNLAPMVTAGNCWVKAGQQKFCFYRDNYFDETTRDMPMSGVT